MAIAPRTSQPQSICQVAPIASRAYGFLLGVSDYDIFGTGKQVTYTGTTKSVGQIGLTRTFVSTLPDRGTLATPSFVNPTTPWASVLVCNPTAVTGRIVVYSANGNNVVFTIGTSGKLSIVSSTSTGSISARVSTINAVTLGTLLKVCYGFDGISWFIYIDGVNQSGASAGTVTTNAAGTTTYIGCSDTLTSGFNGSISLFMYIQGRVDPVSLSANPWQLFALQRNLISYANVSLPTLGSPAADISSGAWTSTAGTLSAAVNESVASDADFISVASGSTCEMVLDNTAFPGGASQTLSYRASSTNASTLTVILKQGVTIIMTRTHALTPTITLYTQTLTSGEIATIIAGAISVTLTSS